MKPIPSRLQKLRQKAMMLQQVVEAAPARAARLRDAVHATTAQFEELGTDLRNTVASLQADSDGSLAQTLVEVQAGVGTLARAGYELAGVDLEQGLAPRLIVQLDHIHEACSTPLDSLVREEQGHRTMLVLLEALQRAETMRDSVHLSDLVFRGVIIHFGAVPTVRLCWRPAPEEISGHASSTPFDAAEAARPASTTIVPPVIPLIRTMVPGTAVPALAPLGGALPGVLFESRSVASGPREPVLSGPSLPGASLAPTPSATRSIRLSGSVRAAKEAVEGEAVEGEADPAVKRGRGDALARFKKMPEL